MTYDFEKIDTPCYLIDENNLIENIKNFQISSTLLPNIKIAYSVKTNPLPWLIRYLNVHTLCDFEIVSNDELNLLRDLNISPKRIILNGPAWTKNDFCNALNYVSVVNIDNLDQIDWLCTTNTFSGMIGLRVNVEYLQNYKDISHFGLSKDDICVALKKLKEHNKNVSGLHFHYVNKRREIYSYIHAAQLVIMLNKQHELDLLYIDFGGGYWSKNICDFSCYTDAIFNTLKNDLNLEKINFIFEPGAGIIADAVVFISKILYIKRINNIKYAITDGGRIYTDPTFSDKKYSYKIFNEKGHEIVNNGKEKTHICGSSCMEQDIIMTTKCDLKQGLYIVYKNMGAYVMCLSPNFINTFPQIYLQSNMNLNIIRNKKKFIDLL